MRKTNLFGTPRLPTRMTKRPRGRNAGLNPNVTRNRHRAAGPECREKQGVVPAFLCYQFLGHVTSAVPYTHESRRKGYSRANVPVACKRHMHAVEPTTFQAADSTGPKSVGRPPSGAVAFRVSFRRGAAVPPPRPFLRRRGVDSGFAKFPSLKGLQASCSIAALQVPPRSLSEWLPLRSRSMNHDPPLDPD